MDSTSNPIDIGIIFKNHIKIEPKVMAIETLFNNPRRFERTNYKPPYQRNYVWNDDKASYFIESILLGTEIPPLIFFNSGEVIEVIDGRQRYETIYRFLNNQFKLKKAGLLKLKGLSKKGFGELDDLKDTIWDTKLRIIEFSFHSKPESEYDIEDVVKKEIFKRYNTGITPLKPTEIDKAKYTYDNLNSYIKHILRSDARQYDFIVKTFGIENDNLETVLKTIRQLLVQHRIPINYYANKKQEVINRFYELLSQSLSGSKEIQKTFESFVKKTNIVASVKLIFEKENIPINRLVLECFYWALSVIENENLEMSEQTLTNLKKEFIIFIQQNVDKYNTILSLFYKPIIERYAATARFLEGQYNISLNHYIINHEEFRKKYKSVLKEKTDADTLLKFNSLRINKPDASSNSIDDICRQMVRQRFMVRPIYQRNEVINKKKSSSIIESILLGIKLPPIFVFKREGGLSEVIDGQQRLLSILGFLGKQYLDENTNLSNSEKHNYSLNLSNGILTDLDRKKFSSLPVSMQDRILDYNLWVIEIDQKNNPSFDPIDLFIRLNYKPYPIKENTFEMWNSYVNRTIIDSVKDIFNKNRHWFYLRKNNTRMDNEGLLMYLIYLQYKLSYILPTYDNISTFLDAYKTGDRISIRIKSKSDITKILDSPDSINSFIGSCQNFETLFISKVRALLYFSELDSDKVISERLDDLMNLEGSLRTNQSFYALWLMLSKVNLNAIGPNRDIIRSDIKALYKLMNKIESKEQFEKQIAHFWNNYK